MGYQWIAQAIEISDSNTFKPNGNAQFEIEQQSYAIQTLIGEAVVLHSKLLDSPMEYQLHYSLVGCFQIKQGLLFAETVSQLLDKLTSDILVFYQIAGVALKTAESAYLVYTTHQK